MSSSALKPLLARNIRVSDQHLPSSAVRSFSAYEEQLEGNLRVILRKHAHLDRKKVADLLEELDNNLDLALQILDAEESHCNAILEERGPRSSPPLSQEAENSLFKKSFLRLYKKYIATSSQLEELQKKYESERAENEKLKQLNQYLLQGEYSHHLAEDPTPIC